MFRGQKRWQGDVGWKSTLHEENDGWAKETIHMGNVLVLGCG
jgi:hypothetical protein